MTILPNGMAESAEFSRWGDSAKRRLLASLVGLALVLGLVGLGPEQGGQTQMSRPPAAVEIP